MLSFLLKRGFDSLVVLLIMSFLIYALIGLMPGDPIDLMLSADPRLTSEDVARLKALYGLDQPLLARFWTWLSAAAGGDFGFSRLYAQPVFEIVWPRLGTTAILMGGSLALSLAIAVPLGLIAARRPGAMIDQLTNAAAFAGISVPPFWLAILLIMLFAVALGWLPAGGAGRAGTGLIDQARFYVLPLLTLTLASVGGLLRFMRAAALEAYGQDYVRTALAKGLSRHQIAYRHVLRNAMIPVVTVIALGFGTLFSGALITETMFGLPGMGKTIFDAILGNDFNLALFALLLATATTLLGNLLADLIYVALDPRIRLEDSL